MRGTKQVLVISGCLWQITARLLNTCLLIRFSIFWLQNDILILGTTYFLHFYEHLFGFMFEIGFSNLRYSDTVTSGHNYSNLSVPDDPRSRPLFLQLSRENVILQLYKYYLVASALWRLVDLTSFLHIHIQIHTQISTPWSRVLVEKLIVTCLFIKSPSVMELKGPLPCVQELATGPCPEPDESISLPHTPYTRSDIILSSTLISSSDIFPSAFQKLFSLNAYREASTIYKVIIIQLNGLAYFKVSASRNLLVISSNPCRHALAVCRDMKVV
jgi:hypothetical protein